MGAVNHIAVTGAGGFLGREIVRTALAQGLQVTAILRRAPDADLGCEVVICDLAKTSAEALGAQLKGVQAIIHAAGEMSSDAALHARSTLPATQVICEVAAALGAHLVHVSSISIYDYQSVPEGGFVTEDTAVEACPEQRDGYVAAKLTQEALVAGICPDASVLRVGALLGPGRVWNAHLGIGLGPALLRLSARGQVPICHVRTGAQVAVQAATAGKSGAVNVLEHDLPTRTRFIEAHAKSGWPRLVVPVPWQIIGALGAALRPWSARPGLLRAPVLHARMKPLGYDTARLEAEFVLPKRSFEWLMKEALRDG